MKKIVISIMLTVITAFAGSEKDYKVEFKVDPNQAITIESVSGMNVKVVSWDNSSVKFDLRVEVSSSDNDYEKEYVENFSVSERRRSSELVLTFNEPEGDGWSLLDIFRLKFHFYIEKDIKGTIYVPRSNALTADFKYSEINLEDITGKLILPGRSNELYLRNCSQVYRIENQYGKTELQNCSGNLELETRSSELRMKNFGGPVNIDADYNDIWLDEIKGDAKINSRSGNMELKNIHGNLEVNAPYTDMKIYNVDGFTDIINRSENILVSNSKGLKVDALYCNMEFIDIIDVMKKTVSISGRSGSINLKNVTGDVVIDDQYSSISLIEVKGDINLSSRSENITGRKIRGNMNFETQYCNISIDEISASRVKMTNRSGQINLDFITNPVDVYLKNDYGGVSLDLLPSYEGEYDLSADYGKINSSIPLRIREHGSSETSMGRIGNKNNKLVVETRSDDIVLRTK